MRITREGDAMPFYCDNQAATQIANNPAFLAFLARCVWFLPALPFMEEGLLSS